MKSKTKFLWMYTIILFSVALILILFAGMTQQNYEKELATHETAKVGLQKSAAELSQTNLLLKQENAELKEENEALKESQAKFEEISKNNDLNIALIEALYQYESGNRRTAKNMLAEIDAETLTDQQLGIYNKIMK